MSVKKMVMLGLYNPNVISVRTSVPSPRVPPRPVIGPSTNRQQQNRLNGEADTIGEENDRVDYDRR